MGSEARESKIFVATGGKGTGKTTQSLRELNNYVLNDTKIGRRGRPVLIFDTNGEESYQKYKSVYFDVRPYVNSEFASEGMMESAKHIKLIRNPEIRRITKFKPNGEEMDLDEKRHAGFVLMKNFHNGCLLLEDFNTYVINANTKDFISTLTTNRHRNQDVYIHFQAIEAIPPRLWQNINVLRIHHQATDYKELFKKKGVNQEMFLIIQEMINHQFDKGIGSDEKYFFVYVEMEYSKVRIPFGDSKYKVDLFKNACKLYLTKYPKVMNELSRELDMKGGKKYKGFNDIMNKFSEERTQKYLKI